MNAPATMGHNNPPDPIDQINAAFDDERQEAENWLDGSPVENEAQMQAVDALRKAMRQWRLDLERGQKSAAAPLHDAWKAALERWKPTIEDAKRIEAGLVAAVDGFKRKLAAEKAEAERKARADAEAKARAAREAALAAEAAKLEAQREAARLQAEAEDAAKAAAKASKQQVKGLRTVTRYEITDHRALLLWIMKNDRDAVTAFIEEYARKEHTVLGAAEGINVWQEKVAV